MPLDQHVTLGNSGLRVSPMCLGAMTFREGLAWGSDVKTSATIIDRYLEHGGNLIDTANVYTYGHSEKINGGHLTKPRSRRVRIVLATKFFGGMHPGDPNSGAES